MKQSLKKLIVRRLMRKVSELFAAKKITVVAVTGTVGKTSAKIAIAQVLQSAGYKVGYSEDSYNSDIGLPLSVFGMKVPNRLGDVRAWRRIFKDINSQIANFPHDVLVQEVAEDDLKLMLPFVKLIKPQVGVITGVSLAHTARMDDLDKIVRDLRTLVRPMKELIYNADFSDQLKGKVDVAATYATKSKADVYVVSTRHATNGRLVAQINLDGKEYEVKTQLVGVHSLSALLAAASVAKQLGVEDGVITRALASIAPVRGRMNPLPAVNEALLIDDSYNAASPVGVFAAIDTLKDMRGRKIAVIGNMNELGDKSESAHREVGAAVAKVADLMVVIGPDAEQYLAPAAIEAGMDKSLVKVFKTPYEAGHFLKTKLTKGDVVLVKGSQNNVFSEEVSRIILDPSLDPADVLVRQSDFWKRKKKKAFAQ